MLGTGKPKLGGLGDVGCLSRNNEGEFRISPNLGVISVIWDFGTRNTKKKNENPPAHLRGVLYFILTTHLPLACLGVLCSLPTCVPRCFLLTTFPYWDSAVPMEAWARLKRTCYMGGPVIS